MGNYTQEFSRLNAAQRAAVEKIQGPLLVIAGPGTGKTQLLSVRVARILKDTDVAPANILCLTFTEAAARNMRERLTELIGEPAYHVGIYTFHSFGTEIIQRYPEYFMDQPLLTAVDELSAYELLSDIFQKLPHSNPLSQKLGEDFLHLGAVNTAIGWLKKAAISPADLRKIAIDNKVFIDFAEALVKPVFAQSPSAKSLPEYTDLLQKITAFKDIESNSLAQLFHKELEQAISETDPSGRYAKPITAWRKKWLVQNQLKIWILQDRRKSKFMTALATVYEQYQAALQSRGWYTYDDMILRTIQALQDHEELRLTLQEQYQYIMADEYQDTNGSQNLLLELLADNPVNENKPNLMVVGDDDQAIYRFQGAEMSVMLGFMNRWSDVERIVLTENYRSGTELLNLNRGIITQGQDRLEDRVPNLSKELVSGHSTAPPARVVRTQTTSELDQYSYVAQEIANLIKNGAKPSSIAVLAPKHSYLKSLVPYLLDQEVPVSYERREHILEQPHIVELVTLARLVDAASKGDWAQVDVLMPLVLNAGYWELDPLEVWNVSIQAYHSKKLWLEIMLTHQNKTLQHFAQAIPVLAQAATSTSLENVLDYLLGNQAISLSDDTTWHIPYRTSYFNEDRLKTAPQEYFTLLGQLTSLRQKLREYHPGDAMTLSSFIEFISLYEDSKLPLLDTNPHASTTESVELMTAYKAKGLEWDTVFLLGVHDNVWGIKARSGHTSFGLPNNLAWIKPAQDSHDDHLRLFYVALTRAKHNLYLTSFAQTLSGKQTVAVGWLTAEGLALPDVSELPEQTTQELIRTQEIQWGITPDQKTSLHDNLRPFLDSYKLSATHVNTFLDLTKGGPKHFFYRHLLHFPEALAPSAVYGSAVHQTLHYLHSQLTRTGSLPPLAAAQKLLRADLQSSSLSQTGKDKLLVRGKEALAAFYPTCVLKFHPTDKSEYGFANEGVMLGEARLTGKVDAIRKLQDNKVSIIDYKTGKPLHDWKPKDEYPKVRAHLNQQQLTFYSLLLSGSANFSDHEVANTMLQFVEPDEDGNIVDLEYLVTPGDQERLMKLVAIIWQHIMDLNFPDTSKYPLDLKGVQQFEDDLLKGLI